jgi:hypothetical protein
MLLHQYSFVNAQNNEKEHSPSQAGSTGIGNQSAFEIEKITFAKKMQGKFDRTKLI